MNKEKSTLINVVIALGTLVGFFIIPSKIIAPAFWPRKINNGPLFSYILMMISHEVIFISINLLYGIVYWLEWDCFEKYKIEKDPWPWKENRNEWFKTLKKTLKILLFNHFVIIPLVGAVNLFSEEAQYRVDYESLPEIREILLHFIFFYLVDDFTFYWTHRFLHWKPIYPYIHKIHHEYRITVSFASEYSHPIEFITSILSVSLGAQLLGQRTHLFTFLMYNAFRMIGTSDAHSGYNFPFSFISLMPYVKVLYSGEFHSYHHLQFTGNFGGLTIFWDWLCGTCHPKYEKVREVRENIKNK